MEYNLRNATRPQKRSLYQTAFVSFGLFGVIGYIFLAVLSVCVSLGIPVAIIWILVHFIHNGYKF